MMMAESNVGDDNEPETEAGQDDGTSNNDHTDLKRNLIEKAEKKKGEIFRPGNRKRVMEVINKAVRNSGVPEDREKER